MARIVTHSMGRINGVYTKLIALYPGAGKEPHTEHGLTAIAPDAVMRERPLSGVASDATPPDSFLASRWTA